MSPALRSNPVIVGRTETGTDRSSVDFGGPARPLRGGPTCAKCESDDRCRRDKFCWRAQRAERLLQRREKEREAVMSQGLDALERMDNGEPQRVEAAAATNGVTTSWSRERAIAAIQEFHREHGRPPRQVELRLPLPSASFVYREFGGHGAAMKAAGLEPVARGRRPAAVKPPQGEKPAEPEPAVPELTTPAVTLADKARQLVQLADQLDQARRQVAELEQQIRQIATEISA